MYRTGLFKKPSSSEEASQDTETRAKKEASDKNSILNSFGESEQVKKVEEQGKRDATSKKYVSEKEEPYLDTDAWYAEYRKPSQESSQTSAPNKKL